MAQTQGNSNITVAGTEFEPGRDMPGYIPLGTAGVATAAQGNTSDTTA